MSASAAQIQRRRAKNAAASKARKTKIRAIVLVCIFAIVLVVQGPRTLKMISGGDGSAPVAVPASPSAAAPKLVTEKVSRALQSLRRNAAGDPFAARAIADRDPRPGTADPAGRNDPFAVRETSQPDVPTQAPPPLVVGTPTQSGVAKRSFIVVLASIETSRGRGTATRFARSARAASIGSIGVVESSKRRPLRAGYYVVYLGSFRTLSAATAAAARAHRRGYSGAYLRQLVRY